MKLFITECSNDDKHFTKPIKKNAMKNFSNDIVMKSRGPSQRNHLDEMKHERNMIGQIFCLAYTNSIDLGKVLSFPLTSVPHSLAHPDGTMVQNSKKEELISLLLSPDNSEYECEQCQYKVEIIDGNYLLNSLKDSPSNYGSFSEFLLKSICDSNALEIHICFNKNISPCLNDLKVDINCFSSIIKINGSNQERPFNLSKCILHYGFKDELVQFLINDWSKNETYEIIDKRRIFLSYGDTCYVYCKNIELGKKVQSLQNDHMEVESKIILHLSKTRETNVKIRTQDPDKMLIYLIYNWQYLPPDKNVCLEFGDLQKNNFKHINVSKICKSLGESATMVKALPAWYVFTGCAIEPCFYNKGRKSWFKQFQKNEYQLLFSNIGLHNPSIDERHLIEKYVCEVYNTPCERVNQAREHMLRKAYTPSAGIDFTKKGLYYFQSIKFKLEFKYQSQLGVYHIFSLLYYIHNISNAIKKYFCRNGFQMLASV